MSMSRSFKTKEKRIREQRSKEYKQIILEYKQKGEISHLKNFILIKN